MIDISPADRILNVANKMEDARERLSTLFIKWYFCLLAGSFVFFFLYNAGVAYVNYNMVQFKGFEKEFLTPYLEIGTTVSLISSALNTLFGFILGYYFKHHSD